MLAITKETAALSKILHTTDAEKRIVVYFAIGEVLITKLINSSDLSSKDYEPKLRIKVKTLVDQIGEVAIIDRSLFENTLISILKFKLYKPDLDTLRTELWDSNVSFYTIIGVNKFYSLKDIELINTNFSTYRDAMLSMLTAYNYVITID